MTRDEHLLTILGEECAEIAHRTSKALRFGIEEVEPEQVRTNGQRIEAELHDLAAVVEMLVEAGLLSRVALTMPRLSIDAKRAKVEHFLKYSDARGTLSEKRGRDR